MTLQTLTYTFFGRKGNTIAKEWSHTGVVGSGDLEILMEQKSMEGAVDVQVSTPVHGFEYIWEMVLQNFVEENALGDLSISINDNNATPFIVSLRLTQALKEAGGILSGDEKGDAEGKHEKEGQES